MAVVSVPDTICDVRVRRLAPGDEDVLRALRLQALADSPHAFFSTSEREMARTHEDWQRWLATGATFAVERGQGDPAGLVAALPDREDANVLLVISMWLHPEARGSGAADLLMQAVLAWAADEGRDVLRLHVTEGNVAALRLYERHGFRLTGEHIVRERDGVRELEMACITRPPPALSAGEGRRREGCREQEDRTESVEAPGE